MALAFKRAPLAPTVRESGWTAVGFPDSYSIALEACVRPSDSLESAIASGAGDTSGLVSERLCRAQEEAPRESGRPRREVLLVCFGAFVRQRVFDKFAAQVMSEEGVRYMGLRTLLAIGSQHGDLCRARGMSRMRLVSLARHVQHDSLWRVPVLHQEDWGDGIASALKLEPYDYGWSAEHVFGFERDADT